MHIYLKLKKIVNFWIRYISLFESAIENSNYNLKWLFKIVI